MVIERDFVGQPVTRWRDIVGAGSLQISHRPLGKGRYQTEHKACFIVPFVTWRLKSAKSIGAQLLGCGITELAGATGAPNWRVWLGTGLREYLQRTPHLITATPSRSWTETDIERTPGAASSNNLAMISDFEPGSYLTHDMLHIRGGHQTPPS
jgi:hypothetical protein